jgi:dihydrofolate reductase
MNVRKIVVSEFLTLDGVMQGPGGPDEDREGDFRYGGWLAGYGFDAEQDRRRAADIDATDAYLFGRRTYDIFASYWPFQPDTNRWAAVLNPRPKYIVSRTLAEPLSWQNSTLISDNVAERIRELKAQPGGNISVLGSGQLVRFLIANDLADELVLMVHPLILGTGKQLFEPGMNPQRFRLADSVAGEEGMLMLRYVTTAEPFTAS